MEVFTKQEAQILRAASKILRNKQEFSFRKSLPLRDDNGYVSFGQLREACDIADEQLFNCLNLAHAHFHCKVSVSAIDGWHKS